MSRKKNKILNPKGLSELHIQTALYLVETKVGVPLSTLCSRCKPKKVGIKSFLKNISEESEKGLSFLAEGMAIELDAIDIGKGYNTIVVKAK